MKLRWAVLWTVRYLENAIIWKGVVYMGRERVDAYIVSDGGRKPSAPSAQRAINAS